MKLLIVEDEDKTGRYLRTGLQEAGFEVELAREGAAGLKLALTRAYDAIILDVMLPPPDGFAILHELRLRGMKTPVLLLTARHALVDRIFGLESGADDYLVKPFAFAELLARLRNLLRRGTARPAPGDCLRVADLELNLARRSAQRAGENISLTAKEFALLELLARRAGETLPRTYIASLIWNIQFDTGTNIVEVAIRRLRAKLDDGREPKLIETVRAMGYRLQVPAVPGNHGAS